MNRLRTLLVTLVAACAALACAATPSMAIVGGSNAQPGEFPAVAEVTFGKSFLCTGTLIDPTHVLTAGHCGSLTGAVIATPITWPTPLIDVRIGSNKSGQGELFGVSKAVAHPNYLATSGYDITILTLSRAATQTPVKVAGSGERSAWDVGDLASIVGWGATSEGGDTPDTLQKAQVPIVSDASCAAHYDTFEADTQVCAGYQQGGIDTCQGDSGGPLFGFNAAGTRRLVGATSYGEGCARPDTPGVYARVADTTLREWIRSQAPNAVG